MPLLCRVLLPMLLLIGISANIQAQEIPLPSAAGMEPPADEDAEPAPERVEVRETVPDEQIAARLQRILEATEWFEEPQVEVDEGVTFLSGRTESDARREWAGNLVRNTQDVVAVVNRIEVVPPSIFDMRPIAEGLEALWLDFLRTLPLLFFGLLVLVVAWFAARGAGSIARSVFGRRRDLTPLLREVLARAIGLLVFLLGLYLVLLVTGLTRLAVTVLGGTGLLGLIIGIAFRDITENFLASIFLSIQRPFRAGDLVEIENITGLVQRLTSRVTVLMTLDGNHIQIPNSMVYKGTIRNFTSNPNRREEFTIGVGYGDSLVEAQEVARDVLRNHPAVLDDPEPWVLVESLGAATVNLKVYFWLDGTKHSWLKVRSSVIRLVKKAYQDRGISMPDEAREVIIPKEIAVRVRRLEEDHAAPAQDIKAVRPATSRAEESSSPDTEAEGGLGSEAPAVAQQAARSRVPEEGQNLL